MIRTSILCALVAPALGFVARSAAHSRPQGLSMRAGDFDLRKAIAAGSAALLVSASPATAGELKFDVFGAGSVSSPFSYNEANRYSYYSPYGDGTGAVYKDSAPELQQRRLGVVTEASKRLGKLDSYIDKAQWEEVRMELNRQMYDLRQSMTGLSKTAPGPAGAAAKQVFSDIEDVSLSTRNKDAAAAKAATERARASLNAYLGIVKTQK
eukprot:CAMPEP_0198419628 /NCGR_PEP_ID=MMETSP1452-20131203/344_1 /TAXON_ID=1181717 /ORGANISM="Synchroma pusillum, Strain CCMP3072" /LENGTH=209 /DNA_ID=CAMNT_0044139763 /DNA_START=91 /DNA_END=720 /DNA_ORIENTATION=-